MPHYSANRARQWIGRVSLALAIASLVGHLTFGEGWQHIGAVKRVDKLPDGIELTASHAKVRVTFLGEGIVRVRVAFDGNFPKDTSWAVIQSPPAGAIHYRRLRDSGAAHLAFFSRHHPEVAAARHLHGRFRQRVARR